MASVTLLGSQTRKQSRGVGGLRGRGYDPAPTTLPPQRAGKVGGPAEACDIWPCWQNAPERVSTGLSRLSQEPLSPNGVGEPCSPALHHPESPAPQILTLPSLYPPAPGLGGIRSLGSGFLNPALPIHPLPKPSFSVN